MQINNDDLIASIDQVGQKLANCLSIAESALTTLVQHRPPSDPNLSEAARETQGVVALPFRLTNIAVTYQDALRGKFADQVGDVHPPADQVSPAVNVFHVGRRPEASLQTILEENPDSESQGSTETIAETTAVQPPFPTLPWRRNFQCQRRQPPTGRGNRGGSRCLRQQERQPCAAPSK